MTDCFVFKKSVEGCAYVSGGGGNRDGECH